MLIFWHKLISKGHKKTLNVNIWCNSLTVIDHVSSTDYRINSANAWTTFPWQFKTRCNQTLWGPQFQVSTPCKSTSSASGACCKSKLLLLLLWGAKPDVSLWPLSEWICCFIDAKEKYWFLPLVVKVTTTFRKTWEEKKEKKKDTGQWNKNVKVHIPFTGTLVHCLKTGFIAVFFL